MPPHPGSSLHITRTHTAYPASLGDRPTVPEHPDYPTVEVLIRTDEPPAVALHDECTLAGIRLVARTDPYPRDVAGVWMWGVGCAVLGVLDGTLDDDGPSATSDLDP